MTAAQKKPGKRPVGLLLWVLFFIVIMGLFMVNWGLIRKTLEDTQFVNRIFNRPLQTDLSESAPDDPVDLPPELSPAVSPVVIAPVVPPQAVPEQPNQTPPAAAPEPKPASETPAARPSQPAAAKTQDRTMYFIQVAPDGTIVLIKSIRAMPASDSPLVDVLQALLQGPSAEEQRRGLMSLIPQGTRVLASTTVRGSTAYINFSEDFQFNTYGVEGYAAQLRQIVWTVTEFSNIKDVQILIDGRRVNYLGESVRIGSPVSREML
jgi:spore germination protein GerM